MQEEIFAIASFRSRQQVLALEGALRRAGLAASIVTTPRQVSLGCGLSVRFAPEDAASVRALVQRLRPGNLIGLYRVRRAPDGSTEIAPLGAAEAR